MPYKLSWMANDLRAAGLKVAEQPGWLTRGRSDMGHVKGVLCHHTATRAPGNMPSLRLVTVGRPDLGGPLCNLALGRDGTWYCVAAGRANHAGTGQWRTIINSGNSQMIGIEAENNGVDEQWPPVQLDSYKHGCAALIKKLGVGPEWIAGHREYTRRKIDPHWIDMDRFRYDVGAIVGGIAPAPVLVPPVDGKSRPTLKRGDKGPDVMIVQVAIGIDDDGLFGPGTEAAVRAFQRLHHLVPDGRVGPKTWMAIDDIKGELQ